MQLSSVLAVKQSVVDIGGPVVKGREQEPQDRGQGNVSGGAAPELLVLVAVLQSQGGVLHRADGAHEIPEHRVRPVGHLLIVPAAVRHVVGVGGQEDEIAALAHVDGVDDPAVQALPGVGVLELRLPQGLEQPVLIAVRHLPGGELNVDQVPAQGAGQTLFQQIQVHLLLLLGQQPQGGVYIGDDLAAAADIAAVYLADGGAVWLEPPPQLV